MITRRRRLRVRNQLIVGRQSARAVDRDTLFDDGTNESPPGRTLRQNQRSCLHPSHNYRDQLALVHSSKPKVSCSIYAALVYVYETFVS